jgi:single-strand DNA-binding protein
MYLNKVQLYGNLTRDPELRALPSGGQVCSFAVATNRTYKNASGEKQEEVEYHNITAFGKLAEVIGQYLKKGRPIYVEGRLRTRSWEDKNGKGKQYKTEIVLENFQFGADSKGGAGSGSSSAPRASVSDAEAPQKAPGDDAIEYPTEDINPDDIPF